MTNTARWGYWKHLGEPSPDRPNGLLTMYEFVSPDWKYGDELVLSEHEYGDRVDRRLQRHKNDLMWSQSTGPGGETEIMFRDEEVMRKVVDGYNQQGRG